MTRATNAPARRRRRKRLFKQAKGFFGDRKNHVRQTKSAVMRAMAFNYRHRKHNKRNFRRLWIIRIGVGAKINGLSYSRMMHGLKKAGCDLNRKVLSDLIVNDPQGFAAVADMAKKALA
ncbi:50S ribosomal protein L20 [Chlamydiales bacterium SCGC AG-110-M15]|nr:50S ribosomal protein L20 [Chlamydiales bacterium SCGC AG-110-M15]